MIKLIFINETKHRISSELFKSLLRRTHGGTSYEDVELLLTDNEGIQAYNKRYRHVDSPTDVLSFSFHDPKHLGQLIISIERAQEQAKELGQSLEEELRFLFTHGVLHLLGYDHENPEDEKKMLKRAYGILGRS